MSFLSESLDQFGFHKIFCFHRRIGILNNFAKFMFRKLQKKMFPFKTLLYLFQDEIYHLKTGRQGRMRYPEAEIRRTKF